VLIGSKLSEISGLHFRKKSLEKAYLSLAKNVNRENYLISG